MITKAELAQKLETIINRYDKLKIKTPLYDDLKKMIVDDKWLAEQITTINAIENSERILDIAKQITLEKNDVRVYEAFAELDTGRNLLTNFYGSYSKISYQLPRQDKQWPDFIAENEAGKVPIEVKLLTPTGLSETKFFQKFVDKINKAAIPQLSSYHKEEPFSYGYIFVWCGQPIPLHNLEYNDLKKWVDDKVDKPAYDVTLLCNFYRRGMWDFPIKSID